MSKIINAITRARADKRLDQADKRLHLLGYGQADA